MNQDELLEHVPLEIFLVLEEDVYETRFGDGYYPYFRHAFLSREAAESFITRRSVKRIECRWHPDAGPCFEDVLDPSQVGSAHHLIPATVTLLGGKPHVTSAIHFEPGGALDPRDIHERIMASLLEVDGGPPR